MQSVHAVGIYVARQVWMSTRIPLITQVCDAVKAELEHGSLERGQHGEIPAAGNTNRRVDATPR